MPVCPCGKHSDEIKREEQYEMELFVNDSFYDCSEDIYLCINNKYDRQIIRKGEDLIPKRNVKLECINSRIRMMYHKPKECRCLIFLPSSFKEFIKDITPLYKIKHKRDTTIFIVERICCKRIVLLKRLRLGSDKNEDISLSEIEFFLKRKNIKSKYIMKRYGVFRENNKIYTLDEYIPGIDLLEYICSSPHLNEDEIYKIALKIYYGILDLHLNNIKHNDLKPDNIIIVGESIKIIDFGYSEILKSMNEKSLKYGYKNRAAPELLLQEPRGMETEWYNYGTILFTLYTKKRPYKKVILDEAKKTITYQGEEEYPNLYPDLEDLIKKLTEKDYTKRLGYNSPLGTEILKHRFFTLKKKN